MSSLSGSCSAVTIAAREVQYLQNLVPFICLVLSAAFKFHRSSKTAVNLCNLREIKFPL